MGHTIDESRSRLLIKGDLIRGDGRAEAAADRSEVALIPSKSASHDPVALPLGCGLLSLDLARGLRPELMLAAERPAGFLP